jgi:hypothetical protein
VVEVWWGEGSSTGSMGRVSCPRCILVANWVIRCLDGTTPWQVLFQHWIGTSQHVGKVQVYFYLCDTIFPPPPTCSKSLARLFSKLYGQLCRGWQFWPSGIQRVVEQVGIWRDTLFEARGCKVPILQRCRTSRHVI